MANHVRDQMDDYLSELLDPGARAHFERHLAGCPSCKEAWKISLETRRCLEWLLPAEAPPEPGPDFYCRVRESIEKKLSYGWFGSLAAAMHPRLAYPLVFLGLLLLAWTLTYQSGDVEDGLLAMEYPATEFAQMAFSDAEPSVSHDLIMMNLVELPEEE